MLLAGLTALEAQVKESNLKAVYIYQLSEHITWHNESEFTHYKVGLYTDDSLVVDNFRQIAKTSKLKNKPIIPVALHSKSKLSGYQILFIDEAFKNNIPTIADEVQNEHTLLITFNSQNRLFFMINLFRNSINRSIEFEVNTENIQSAGLEFAPEIMLLGGSLVDLKGLYKKTLKELDIQVQRHDLLTEEINALSQDKERFVQQMDTMQSHIYELISSITSKELESDSLNRQIEDKNATLNVRTTELVIQREELDQLRSEYSEQVNAITQSQKHLQELNDEIQKKELLLDSQETTIISQTDKIQNQQKLLLIVLALALASVAAVVAIYSTLRLRKKLNKQLVQSNEQLAQQKSEIESTLLKLKQTQKQLIESEKMASLGMLTAGMAHEIKNPINFIYGGSQALKLVFDDFIEVLKQLTTADLSDASQLDKLTRRLDTFKEDDVPLEISSLLAGIDEGVERTTAIIDSLNAYSYDSQEKFQPYLLVKAIDNALLILKSKYKHTISITKNYADSPLVDCYPGKLNQVFLNILSNAIQAIKSKGQITITVVQDHQNVIAVFEDNGAGMSQDTIKKAYDPFFTTKEVGLGTGLGLYLTYSIIKQHKGNISIESELGKGTRVEITLPLVHKES